MENFDRYISIYHFDNNDYYDNYIDSSYDGISQIKIIQEQKKSNNFSMFEAKTIYLIILCKIILQHSFTVGENLAFK